MKRITLRIPDNLHEFLRVQAFETRESINNIILEILEQMKREEERSELYIAAMKEEKK